MTSLAQPDLYSLVYTSTASRPLAKSDLEQILANARKRNLKEQVTGLLLFSDGKFMQYLEGPKSGVLKIFDYVQNSSQHKDIVEVSRQPVENREYADWSMAFLADVDAHALPSSEDAQLMRGLEADATDNSSTAHDQLSEFWKKP